MLLLLSLSACNTSKSKPVAHNMSPQRMTEIERAWQNLYGTWFGVWWEDGVYQSMDGIRYYGTCNGYDILYRPTYVQRLTDISFGDISFAHPATFSLLAYREGQFYSLRDLYQHGMVTRSQLQEISQMHLVYEDLLGPIAFDPQVVLDEEIKRAYLRQYDSQGQWTTNVLSVIHYGTYQDRQSNKAYVCMIDNGTDYPTRKQSELFGGVVFVYSNELRILVYYKEKLISLQEAYETGLLDQGALSAINRSYQTQNPAIP